MESSDCMTAFLLLVLFSGVHLSPDPVDTIKIKGGLIKLGDFRRADDGLLYRVYEDGDLLLVNCSQPDRPPPDGYNITCPGEFPGFRLNNLTMSHSGDYRVEKWKRRKSSQVRSTVYRLTVCVEGDVDWYIDPDTVYARDGSAVVCEFDSALGIDSSLQLYEYDVYKELYTLVLDTSSSLESLVPYWRDRLQVDTNTSRFTLTEIIYTEGGKFFLCTMSRRGQCQQARKQQLLYVSPLIVTHEKENVTLSCTFRGDFPKQVYWKTPTGDVRISNNQTRPQEVMYMLNGSQSGDHSLIIPSVSRQHDGEYDCYNSKLSIGLHIMRLLVCVELSSVKLMFSHSESVLMDTHVNDSETLRRAQWFRQKDLHPQMLITEYVDKDFAPYHGVNDVHMPKDLMGRVPVFNSSTSLNISNLTAEDSGVYTWRIIMGKNWYGNVVCHQGSIRLLYRDPFGVHSPFYKAYSPLLGCVLLGLVATVVWLKLRSRGGVLTPGGQEMEMQDIGDEDVYDDVEEVLTPCGQEMEMQDIGDEDVHDDVEEAED